MDEDLSDNRNECNMRSGSSSFCYMKGSSVFTSKETINNMEVKSDDLGLAQYKDLLPYSKSSDVTEVFLKDVFDIMLKYIFKSYDRKSKILDFHHPHQFLQSIEGFSLELTGEAESLHQILVDCSDTLKYGVKTGHPRFFNQLSSGLDIVSLAAEWITAAANTNMFTFEIAPVFVLMEGIVLQRMRQIIGWEKGDGIFSPGGTINNFYAVMLARQKILPDVKQSGMRNAPDLVMFQSKHAHYSNRRPAAVLGIGMKNCIDVKVDEVGRMLPEDLELKVLQAKVKNKVPFYVSATSGTTVLGAFDPIPEIAAICKKYNLWLHIDAAWGGGVLMSRKHRHFVDGIELADSVTWNPHKIMGIVLQCSALLVRHKGALEACNSMKANYLFQQDKHYDVSYDTGDKTMQCGRHVDVFKLWLAWRAKGDAGFEEHVDKCVELSKYLAQKIKLSPGFELAYAEPKYTNVCFWYYPPSIRNINDLKVRSEKLHKVAPAIKARMMTNGSLMVSYQPLDDKVNFFRNVISNPAVRKEDIDFLIKEIEKLGCDL
ncbi:glutamate decarboxylase 1-like [Clavelina lepadiformis]|uniref:Glutamate decarboxylase n=1 Tax=Clavelina lepadiformis TaxID=159417 RepID=A0ABP0EXV1_CLALP